MRSNYISRKGIALLDYFWLSRFRSINLSFHRGTAFDSLGNTGEVVCLFSHFDPNDVLEPYVIYYLEFLFKTQNAKTIIISTCKQIATCSSVLSQEWCAGIIYRDNIGLDFFSWKVGLRILSEHAKRIDNFRLLILANDSCFGPLFDFSSFTSSIADSAEAVLGGITENFETRQHLQSYFLIFNNNCINSAAFRVFWDKVRPLRSKQFIIRCYEIGLTQEFERAGIKIVPFVSRKDIVETIKTNHVKFLMEAIDRNPTLFFWDILLRNKLSPFIKRAIFSDRIESRISPQLPNLEAELKAISKYPFYLIRRN